MLGQGRPKKSPAILAVRELTAADLLTPKGRAPAVKVLRDSHHMVARLVAMGLRSGEVAERTGYSLVRISILKADPAFLDLVASYRADVNEAWRTETNEYFSTVAHNRTMSARLINDTLAEADVGDIPLNQLVAIHADSADRTGYPKLKAALNVNLDFASQLDQAIERSKKAKVIDHDDSPPIRHGGNGAGEAANQLPAQAPPQPLRRRA